MAIRIMLEDDEAIVLFNLFGAKVLWNRPDFDPSEREVLAAFEASLVHAWNADFDPANPDSLERAKRDLLERLLVDPPSGFRRESPS